MPGHKPSISIESKRDDGADQKEVDIFSRYRVKKLVGLVMWIFSWFGLVVGSGARALFFFLSVCLYVCLSVCLSVCLFVCLFVFCVLCVCVRVCACVCVCVRVRVYVGAGSRPNTHTHLYVLCTASTWRMCGHRSCWT